MSMASWPSTQGQDAIIQNLQGVQLFGASLNVAAGDIHNHTTHNYYCETVADSNIPRFPPGWDNIENHRLIQVATLGKATQGTGLWVRQFESWRIWLEPGGFLKIMWGYGMPGAGKTILSSIVISALQEHAKANPVAAASLDQSQPKAIDPESQICVCFIYFRYSDHTKAQLRFFLEILVKQTIERHPQCLPLFDIVYAQHNCEKTQPTEEELLMLLGEFTRQIQVTFYVLDALDEAPTHIQLELLQKLTSLSAKLFVTSRPLSAIEAHFPYAFRFPIVAQAHDIDLHVEREISRSADLSAIVNQGGRLLRLRLHNSIREKCGGMFLHASLQLAALRECTSPFELESVLAGHPSDIEEMYQLTWNRILNQPSSKVLIAKRILMWVLYATRSLTVKELQYAIAVCPQTHRFEAARVVHEDVLIASCRGLVVIEEKANLVRLVHYTASDVLHRLSIESSPHPHTDLVVFCMAELANAGFQHITFDDVQGLRGALHATPLLDYAYSSWAFHAHKSLGDPSTTDQILRFILKCTSFPVKLSRVGRWTSALDTLGPLQMVICYGLPIAMAGIPNLLEPNSTTGKKRLTALHLACLQGRPDPVRLLLHFRSIAVNALDGRGRTPLLIASELGYTSIVQLLIAHPNTDVNLSDADGKTPLHTASVLGHGKIVKILLSHPNIKLNLARHYTALIRAFMNDQQEALENLLSDHRVDFSSAEVHGATLLTKLAIRGFEDAVKIILSNPTLDVNQVDHLGRTSLHRISQLGLESMAKLVLSHPLINVNLVDPSGHTALSAASEVGHEGIVKLLLSHRWTNVNAGTVGGQSPLGCAAEAGHKGIVALLVAHPDIDVNARDQRGRTALTRAAEEGCTESVEILLAHPLINVNIVDGSGHTALNRGLALGSKGIVKLLLSYPGTRAEVHDLEDARRLAEQAIFRVSERRCIVALLENFLGANCTFISS